MAFPTAAATAYDEVRYSNHPYAQTHPERLGVIGVLHGLDVPRPSTARVLEFACGAGANLLGMTYAYPHMRALGIDLAATAIEDAQEAAAGVGLENVEFMHGDVRDYTDGQLGEFDYVIAHGLYAWVPADVQDALLASIGSHLAPDGLAYVSYNAQPGGHIRTMIREMGLFHVRDVDADDAEKGRRAREFFDWLQMRIGDDSYGKTLEMELPALVSGDLARIVHDDFSPNWSPVYFSDFMSHAREHGLDYVGEAVTAELADKPWPEGVEEKIHEIAGEDRITREQYGDFLICRRFRMSVLCRAGREVVEKPQPEFMRRLTHQSFKQPEDVEQEELRPLIAIMRRHFPDSVPFEAFVQETGLEADDVAARLLRCFTLGYSGPQLDLPQRAGAPGERPRAGALARYQCERGDEFLTTINHSVIRVNEPEARAIIPLMDGTRTAAELHEALVAQGLEVSREEVDLGLVHLGRIGLLHE